MKENSGKGKKIPLGKSLLERRLPQILLIYLGICWTILEFISWLVDHFMLSPYLVDLSFVTVISLFPAVGILAYFHGKPGRDQWTKVEKIGIPINLLITAVLLFSLFFGKDLGATTTSIVVENETGERVERKIPKSEFRKRVAIFFFENETGDSTLDWIQYATMIGCYLDLQQDPFFSVYSAYDYLIYQKIMQAGFQKKVDIPMALERKIAREIQRKYFIGGSFSVHNDTFVIKNYLYETERGKLISENSFEGKDIFRLLDRLSLQLKRDLEIPDWHIESVNDLPVSEITTNSMTAFEMFIDASNLINFKNDYRSSIEYFEQAVREDPTFAIAYWGLYGAYINNNQPEKAAQALQSTMQHLYKLPESIRFRVKEEYYFISENPDKRLAVLEMWVKLYPKDVNGHFYLAAAYLERHQLDDVISEYKSILEMDPERQYYLRYIGDVYKLKGQFEKALKHYEQYKKSSPDDYISFSAIGDLFYTMGNYNKAKSYFIEALVIEPTVISSLCRLGDVEVELGNFDKAMKQYHDALKLSKTPQDNSDIYSSLERVYERKGQLRKSVEYMNRKFLEQEKYMNPIDFIVNKLTSSPFSKYVKIGDSNVALEGIQTYQAVLSKPWSRAIYFGYLDLYLEQEDIEKSEDAIVGVEEAVRIFSEESKKYIVLHALGRISELRSEYEQAIINYYREFEFKPTDVTVCTDIGRCYRKIGEFGKAEKFLLKVLKILPFYPEAHYEIALVYADMGDNKKALEHLEMALDIWIDADPEYKLAKEAREKLEELRNIS